MKVITQLTDSGLIASLKAGGIAVLRTDTLYGLVASANSESAVQKIYDIKGRNPAKACIVLIADQSQLLPGTQWTREYQDIAAKYWPGPVTIITPVTKEVPNYIRRHQVTVAYRLPDREDLRTLLRQTGPLIAPSANPEGHTPATTIDQAIDYFGDKVAYYVDGGVCDRATASRIIQLDNTGHEETVR